MCAINGDKVYGNVKIYPVNPLKNVIETRARLSIHFGISCGICQKVRGGGIEMTSPLIFEVLLKFS